MANYPISWKTGMGVNHVGAYQVSGRPFASGSITSVQTEGPVKIEFPFVTRWVEVYNVDHNNSVRVAFSSASVQGTNYFQVGKASHVQGTNGFPSTGKMEIKISEIWVSGSGANAKVNVVAGLTAIRPESVSGSDGPSWSGSYDGVA